MSTTPMRSAAEADFIFKVGEGELDAFRVLGFTGIEGISELYEFHVDLCSDDPNAAIDTFLGQPCFLEIASTNGWRHVHGIIRRFERSGHGSGISYYSAIIVPAHWLLTKRVKSRIYQETNCSDMTVGGIIKKVFDDGGIPQSLYRFALSEQHAAHEYVVQYRESDMNFISRLMEEEGVFYFFEHSAEGYKLVIGDSDVVHALNPIDATCVYRDPSGLVGESEYIYSVRDAREVQVGATRLTDFDFKSPPTQLLTNASAAAFTALEMSDFPGEYTDKTVGQRLTDIRLQEQQCRRSIANMAATVRSLMPGFKFSLSEHPTEALNREFIVTRVEHRARQTQSAGAEANPDDGAKHETDLQVIPSDVKFRPPRVTERPTVTGSQTARVVGPSGEEIFTDEYGRVKVQFHWDLEGTFDENSSRWIRVSQGMAGGNYGMMFLPRVGQEVVVDFLEGDPDRPIITGRVYNNDHMPPYTLPDEKTKSVIKTHSSKGGGGTNEIRIEDLKDSEQILIYAQKDFHERVLNDHVMNVLNDQHITVVNNKNELVKADRSLTVEGNLKEQIKTDVSTEVQGKESKKVAGTCSLTVDGDVVEKFSANHKHEVTTTYAAKAQNIKLEASTGIELKVGGNHIIISASGIEIKQGGASVGLSGNTVFIKGAPTVMINTAPAPPGTPVGPVSASATSPEAPAAPIDSDEVTPGHDTTYNPDAQEYAAVEVESTPASPVAGEPAEPVETTWIEIELIDEADQPVAGERYELKLPDGKIRKGTLDANGLAHVEGLPPGECQICFPDLDSAAWERI